MTPKTVTDLDLAFPASIGGMLPEYKEIPEDFKLGHTPQNRLVDMLFYRGGKVNWLVAKAGINAEMAIRHITCCLRSFEPKHEHKTAGVAYLFSQWFEPFTKEDVETKAKA